MEDDPTMIKRRIEALATMALLDARAQGGDNAVAAMDLLCAFVVLTTQSGADPDRSRDAAWEHAKTVVADFWPEQKLN